MNAEQSTPTVWKRQARQLRFMSVAVTLLCAELVAIFLLKLHVAVSTALALPFSAALAFLTWPLSLAFAWAVARVSLDAARRCVRKLGDRRLYRYSLRQLLLFVLVIAFICAWYGHRLQRVHQEEQLLYGSWHLVHEDGTPVLINGSDAVIKFDHRSYSVDPFHDPKWITFYDPNGTTEKGIYTFENGKLRLMQSSSGMQRPTSFEQETFLPLVPGSAPGVYGMSNVLLERVPLP